ncbi:Uncharacterised protein [Bordetella pertussis]|nr:Uncharacterised protein [Bordetella pertussis]
MSHTVARRGTEPLTGSRWRSVMMALILLDAGPTMAPSTRPSPSQPCHQPNSAIATFSCRSALIFARRATSP